MTLLIVLGLLTGTGLCTFVRGASKRRRSLYEVVARQGATYTELSGTPLLSPVPRRLMRNPRTRAGLETLAVSWRSEQTRQRLNQDLALLEQSEAGFVLQTALYAVAGTAAALVCVACLGVVGFNPPKAASLIASIAIGLATAALVSAKTHRSANEKRGAFLGHLAAWLELVTLAQAGGMGIESALQAASAITDAPTFDTLRRALQLASDSGNSPWQGLHDLGTRLGIDELSELAATVALAGSEGARIRASLTAKSASLRRRQRAEAEERANATTERLFIPSVILMLGFMIFLMYPAGIALSHAIAPS